MTYAKVFKTVDGFDIGKIAKFLKSIGYAGIYDIEFKYVNGVAYFIEINFRHGSPGYALTKAGVNIPFIWYLEACGLPINDMKKKIDADYYLMVETWDIRHILNGNIKITHWLKDLLRTKAFLFFSLKDVRPVIARLLMGANRIE